MAMGYGVFMIDLYFIGAYNDIKVIGGVGLGLMLMNLFGI